MSERGWDSSSRLREFLKLQHTEIFRPLFAFEFVVTVLGKSGVLILLASQYMTVPLVFLVMSRQFKLLKANFLLSDTGASCFEHGSRSHFVSTSATSSPLEKSASRFCSNRGPLFVCMNRRPCENIMTAKTFHFSFRVTHTNNVFYYMI